jgi:exopolysaccharide biosynthesis polyprenyl glycosylphosphotransferase
MFRRFSVNFALFALLLDAALVASMLRSAVSLRPGLNYILPFAADYPTLILIPWPVYLLAAMIWSICLLLTSVYDGRRSFRLADELTNLTIGSLLASGATAGALYLSFRDVSRLLFILSSVLAYLSLVGWRVTIRPILQARLRRQARRRVLIVGAGPIGQELAQQIRANPEAGLEIVGFLDSQPETSVLGPASAAARLAVEHSVDDIVIALPQHAYQQINQLAIDLTVAPVRLWVIPDTFKLALHQAVVEEFAGIPLMDLRASALRDDQRLLKRLFDLILTLLLLPVILPMIGLTALAIWLDDRRPVLFFQSRVGENGKVFTMIKFRTMKLDVSQSPTPAANRELHKFARDPRVTRVGWFLRRSSLDELPQIYNILRGEMSWVGPRPELPDLVDRYAPWQRRRFTVPQGITGWWQVNGRSEKPMHLNTDYDLYYVQNYSLLLDVQILIRTIGCVLTGRGAF